MLGRRIVCNNAPLPDLIPSPPLVQRFESFAHGEVLPSTYAIDPFPGRACTGSDDPDCAGPSGFVPIASPVSQVSFWNKDIPNTNGTSIRLKTANAMFRYCWGTFPQEMKWWYMPEADAQISFDFKVPSINCEVIALPVQISASGECSSQGDMYSEPFYRDKSPVGIRIYPSGGVGRVQLVVYQHVNHQGGEYAFGNFSDVLATMDVGTYQANTWVHVTLDIEALPLYGGAPASALASLSGGGTGSASMTLPVRWWNDERGVTANGRYLTPTSVQFKLVSGPTYGMTWAMVDNICIDYPGSYIAPAY